MQKSTKATPRNDADGVSGSHPTSGEATMRPMVMALGRFTAEPRSGQSLQNQLADPLERLEDALAGHGDGFEIRRALDPLPGRKLLDQVLAGMVRIGRHLLLLRVGDFPARIHRRLQILD